MIKPKEKPIIFSTPSIPAIQNLKPGVWPAEPIDPGKPWKWQTRRIVKDDIVNGFDIDIDGKVIAYIDQATGDSYKLEEICPYPPGARLWVRETFCEVPYEHNHVPIKGGYITIPKYAYKADSERDYTGIWKPSIHMPREAARIFLQVTNVRVERLQDITEEDAIAEGMSKTLVDGVTFISAKGKFHALWDTLYAKRGHPWENNPWVWVYEFMRIE